MKIKNYLSLLLLQLLSISTFATSYTWTGTTSTNYGVSTNWNPNGVPNSGDLVTIVDTINDPVLDSNRTVLNFTMTSGTFNLGGFTFTVNTNSWFDGGTISNGLLRPNGLQCKFQGTTFDAEVNSVSARIYLHGSIFNEPASFQDTGYASTSGTGGNVFNDVSTFIKASTAISAWALGAGNVHNGDATFINYGNNELYATGGDTTYFNGNIIVASTDDDINFGGTADWPVYLASGKTIQIHSGIGFSSGTLQLRKLIQLGSTAQNLSVTGTAIVNIINSTFNGKFTLSAPVPLAKGNVFQDSVYIKKIAGANGLWDGGNTFNAPTTIHSRSNGQMRLATTTADKYNSHIVFLSDSTGDFRPCYTGSNDVKGNLTATGHKVELDAGSGEVRFTGTASQTIYGSEIIDFKKIKIDKASGNVTCDTAITVSDTLKLYKGNLITTATKLLTMKAGSKVVSASDSSFVSGPVKKTGNTAFAFPVGKNSSYRAIEISAPSSSTDAFTAEYFDSQQTLGSTTDTTVEYLSECNYWNLTKNNGSSNVYVKLSWDSSGCTAFNRLNGITVMQWETNKWKDKGKGTLNGDYIKGTTQTLNALSSFGYFTWGLQRLVVPDCILPNPALNANCEFELICNGGLEQGQAGSGAPGYVLGTTSLHNIGAFQTEVINWEDDRTYVAVSSADLYIRGNTSGTSFYNIPNNGFVGCFTGGLDTWNGAGNNRYVGFYGSEGVLTNLIAPVVEGPTYTLTFRATVIESPCNSSTMDANFTADINVNLKTDDFPLALPTFNVGSFPIANDDWNLYSITFTLPAGSPPMENLFIDGSFNVLCGTPPTPCNKLVYFFIDDISLTTTATASFTNDPPCINQPTQFNCFFNGATATYDWDFGDGSTSTQQNPTHTYTEPGYYQVFLQVNTTSPACSSCFRKYIYVSPSCCAVDGTVTYTPQNIVPDNITTNTTWSQTYFLNRTIFVDPGVILTIDDNTTIEFGPEGRIVVDRADLVNIIPGAQLVLGEDVLLTSITNTFTGCPVMWQGVEVWGHSTISHFNPSTNQDFHGRMTMDDGSVIENAHNGVILGRTQFELDDPCNPPPGEQVHPPFDLNYCGGILTAHNSDNLFNQNGIGVRILPFPFFNATRINGCRFTGHVLLDPFYDIANSPHYTNTKNPYYGQANQFGRGVIGIWQWRVRNINFLDNNFWDIQAGMESHDARFRVNGNTFFDHGYGIDIHNSASAPIWNTHFIGGNTFSLIGEGMGADMPGALILNNAGIRINGGRNDIISTNNIFGDVTYNSSNHVQPYDFTGIQLLRTNNFNILDNEFRGIGFGVYSDNSASTYGLIGYGSEGNSLEENQIGIFSWHNNPALIIRCNQWKTEFPLTAAQWCWNNPTGTLPLSQGQPHPTDETFPAGNLWNTNDPLSYKFIASSAPYVYESHEEVLGGSFPSVIPFPMSLAITVHENVGNLRTSTSCENIPCDPCSLDVIIEKMDSLQAEIDTLEEEYNELEASLDNGITDELLQEIYDSTVTSAELKTLLLDNSPLSDTVLLAYTNRPYHVDENDFKDVMTINLMVSLNVIYDFIEKLEQIEDTLVSQDLIELQGHNPEFRTLTSINREIESITLARKQLLSIAISDLVENDSINDLINLLADENDRDSKIDLVSTYIFIDSTSLANELIETMDYDDEEFEDWRNIMFMLIELQDSGKTVFSMNEDQLEMITDISEKATRTLAVSHAQSILKLVKGIEFTEGEFEFEAAPRLAMQQTLNQNSPKSIKIISTIAPNPAKNKVAFTYAIPFGVKVASLHITDVSGKEIKSVYLPLNENTVTIETKEISNGIYFLSLHTDNYIQEVHKLIISK